MVDRRVSPRSRGGHNDGGFLARREYMAQVVGFIGDVVVNGGGAFGANGKGKREAEGSSSGRN